MQQTVLTVEDTTGFRQLIRMALEFGGYEVLEAPDGTQGLAMARAKALIVSRKTLGGNGATTAEACVALPAKGDM